MPTVTRLFDLDEKLRLPPDTAIIPVPPAPSKAKETLALIGSTPPGPLQSDGCATCSVSGLTKDEPDDLPADTLLVASPSAASYFAIPHTLRAPLEVLLAGGTIEDAIAACGPISMRRARIMVRDLLSHIEFRSFYADLQPEEYIPDGAMLQIYVTNRCNLRCRHCYMESGLPLSQGEVGTEDRLRALEFFAEMHPGELVTFTGGEALLDPDIFKLLARARALNLRTELYSNGLTIHKSNVATIAEMVDDLQISLDGATARAHEAIRGKRTFRATLKAIRLIDAWAQKVPTFRYRLSFTLTPLNWEDIQTNLQRLLVRLDLKAMNRVQIGAGNGIGRAGKNPKMYSTVEDMRRIQSSVMHALAKKGVVRLPIFSSNRFTRTCGQGATIAVGADGSIFPCNITDQPKIGNIRSGDARAMMASVQGYIAASSVDQVEGCNRCPIWYFCGGICRITNFKVTGSFAKSACTPAYKSAQLRALVRRYKSFEISAHSYDQEISHPLQP